MTNFALGDSESHRCRSQLPTTAPIRTYISHRFNTLKSLFSTISNHLLVDITRNNTAVETLFGEVNVIVEDTSITEQEHTFDTTIDSSLVGSEGEEELMETLHVLSCLDGAVL